ncbi:ankyrin repeats (3 copies) domain-containing [Fusarium acutatum]|uniref:Ankyrin repeats (3 copies) domain-containing n=1 Tax=Fusarium acutatum TaxID=78861 RepID=A0A8H4J9U6_9HYPO|nr:ankyrin repeats (3 copies) domain-containing [Fusarium acutatum]
MNEWEDTIEACLRRGGRTLNIDQIDHSGRSALHYASRLGNFKSRQALIQAGASLTLQDRLGRTAFQDAADAGFKECLLLLLLESGRADPSQRDIEGRNLAHWAATLDCVDAMELTSKMSGAKLDQQDHHGKTPIDIAFICRSKYVGLFLADKVPWTNIYY